MINIGNKIDEVYVGSTNIAEAYVGSQLVWKAVSIPPASSYIQNGLVFQLDGIEKGNVANKWTDLINGWQFTTNSYAIALDNCVYFRTRNIAVSYAAVLPPNADYTVEFVTQPLGAGIMFWSGNSDLNNIVVYINYNGALQFLQRNKTWVYTFDLTKVSACSCNLNRALINGTYPDTQKNGTYWTMGASTGMGTRNFYGYIYAIRIYNRLLTEEEQIYNQQLDNVRFNLGLDI